MSNTQQSVRNSDIDLVDLWIILRRHLWLFAAVFVVIFVLGIIVTSLQVTRYKYSLTLELGGLRNLQTNVLVHFVTNAAAAEILENVTIPAVLSAYGRVHPGFNPSRVKIDVDKSNTEGVITLQSTGTLAQDGLMRKLLSQVADNLIQNQGSVLNRYMLANQKSLAQQIATLQSQVSIMQASRQRVVTRGTESGKALTLLLIDSQIASTQRQILDLQQRLNVGSLMDVQPMEAAGAPQRSLNPVGLSKIALVIISFLLALIVAVIIVFLAHISHLTGARTPGTA